MKLCGKCQYGMAITFGNTDDGKYTYGCDYLYLTGQRRPCPADQCTVFKEKTRRRRPAIKLKGSRP